MAENQILIHSESGTEIRLQRDAEEGKGGKEGGEGQGEGEGEDESLENIPDTEMRKAWYPIVLSEEINSKSPLGLRILGDPIVLYRDPSGNPICLEDRCAHRSAPLSIGQIFNGTLECKYHGWKYDGTGKVTHIPALLPDRKIPSNAQVKSYPVVEFQGMVWVWPGPAELADPSLIYNGKPFPDEDASKWYSYEVVETLDIDHSLMVENLLDPAHLPFTHDGTISKRDRATPLKVTMAPEKNGFSGKMSSSNQSIKGKFTFTAPCHVLLENEFRPGWKFVQVMHCVPTAPGHMRLFYRQFQSFGAWLAKIPGLKSLTQHYSRKIIYQDYDLLHGQQERLDQGAKAWNSPIQVDRLPKTYRNWLSKALAKQPYFVGYNDKNSPAAAIPKPIPKAPQSQSYSPFFISVVSLSIGIALAVGIAALIRSF